MKNNLYFGVGLCSRTKLSVGLPFDILEMFLQSEVLRKNNNGLVFVHLADKHALENGFEAEAINNVVNKYLTDLQSIIDMLGLKNHTIIRASEICSDSQYQTYVDKLSDVENPYLRLEIADMLWYENTKDVGTKIGWRIDPKINTMQKVIGENFFDTEAMKRGSDLSFFYCHPGFTLNAKKPYAPPYIAFTQEDRILLDEADNFSEEVLSVFDSDHLEYFKSHLQHIIGLYQQVTNQALPGDLVEKIKIIGRTFNN